MPTAHLAKQINIYLEENQTRLVTFETNLAQPSKIYANTMKTAKLLDFLNNNYQLGYKEDFFTKKIEYKGKEIEKLQKLLVDLPLSSKRNDTFRIEIMNFAPLEKLLSEYEGLLPRTKRNTQRTNNAIMSGGERFDNFLDFLKAKNIIGCRKDLTKIGQKDMICIAKILKKIDNPKLSNMGSLREMLIEALTERGNTLKAVSLNTIAVILEPNAIKTNRVTAETLKQLLSHTTEPYQNTPSTPGPNLGPIVNTLGGVSNQELKRVFKELTQTVQASLDKQEKLFNKAQKEFKSYESTAVLSLKNSKSLTLLEQLEKENDLEQALLIGNTIFDQLLDDIDRAIYLIQTGKDRENYIEGNLKNMTRDENNRITVEYNPIIKMNELTGWIEPTEICGTKKCIKFTMNEELIGNIEMTKLFKTSECEKGPKNEGFICPNHPIETPDCLFPTFPNNCTMTITNSIRQKARKLNPFQMIVANLTEKLTFGRVTLHPKKVYMISVKTERTLMPFKISLLGRKDLRYQFQIDEFPLNTEEIDKLINESLLKLWANFFLEHSLINSIGIATMGISLIIISAYLCCKKGKTSRKMPDKKHLERKSSERKKRVRIVKNDSDEDIENIPLKVRYHK